MSINLKSQNIFQECEKKDNEYNKIAQEYENATLRPIRKLCYEHTIKGYIPDLSGKRVLDIGCGEGVSTRMMKELGAKEVVGFDSSSELIKKAEKKDEDKDGISYHLFDVFSKDWGSLGKFDVITGIMIIHYADTEKKIAELFLQIKNSLNDDGVFYGLTVNPEIMKTGYKQYGVKISQANQEGAGVTTELHDLDWNKFCEFTNYYWSKDTYTKILKDLGLEVEFKPGLVSPEGVKKYGKEFWDDYYKNPIYNFITVKKSKPL